MKYIVFDLKDMTEHNQSGIAHNVNHVHETRTMSVSEVMLIIDGEIFMHHLEDYHLVKNDIFFLPQGIKHYGTKPSDCELHWHHFFLPTNALIIDEKDLVNIDSNKTILPMQFNLKDPEKVLMLSYQLEQYPWNNKKSQKIRNALMTSLICEIAYEKETQVLSFNHKRLNAIKSYIDNNFQHNEITIKDLANKFDYNEKYIFKLFKDYLSISPLQYIIEQKMKEAKQMLLNSSETIETIALNLHYNNPQYFMRQFKKTFNMTPTEMRKCYSKSLELYLGKD